MYVVVDTTQSGLFHRSHAVIVCHCGPAQFTKYNRHSHVMNQKTNVKPPASNKGLKYDNKETQSESDREILANKTKQNNTLEKWKK